MGPFQLRVFCGSMMLMLMSKIAATFSAIMAVELNSLTLRN